MPFPYLSGLIFGDEQLNLTEHMGNTNTKQTSWWKQGEGHGVDRIPPKATCTTGGGGPWNLRPMLSKRLAPFGQAPPPERLGWLEENHGLAFSSPRSSRGQ